MSYPPREGSRDTRQGLVISKYPDVCRSPTACVPYTIVAYQSDDAGTAASVRMTGQRAHKHNSIITTCYGDEPGVGLGIKSNTVGSVCHRKTHSKTVRIEGQWATRDTDEWYMNNRNTIGKLTWSSNSPSHTPTPPLQETPDRSAGNQQGQVMSDAAPFTYEPGKEYAFLDTGATGNAGQSRFAPSTPADQKPPTQTPQPTQTQPKTTPPTNTPPPKFRWWRILKGANIFLRAQMELTNEAFDRLMGMPKRLEEAHQKDLEAQGLTPEALGNSMETKFKNTDFGRWYPGTFTDYAKEVSSDPTAEERLQRQWQEETQEKKGKPAETDTYPPEPIGRTKDNVSVKGEKKKRECRCITGAYDDIKNVCGVACGAGYQAHHIVPDYTLRYGNRAEAEKGQKRIKGLPTFGQGPSICLKGYAADAGSEHGLAHQADNKVAALGSGWSTPQGTADIASIRDISRDAAVKATAGECRKEIDAALNAQPSLRSNILGRTTIMPPAEGTEPYNLLSTGARATVH
ncbi:DUF4150 domain-containing protein [Agrobacterium vitis]|uniref:DUF4150 domain-containing protein n=1 Tax=Agrobacterium vitis TaxID=373 RepID=A0AAE2R9N4_AGRVI|nr:DUF4150 domain-containing protein [Agrobacterium vitis]MBF2714283.1 DUF4150 domain-containing protein [Agrobacterium vitis]